MRAKKGFTLVEILFVVIIAAGAMALAFPSLKSVRERAKFQEATGQLIHLGSALESISRDLAMQGINYVPSGEKKLYQDTGLNVMKKTLKEVASELGVTNTTVGPMLLPFGYLQNAIVQGQNGYNFWVGGSGDCADGDKIIVACMLKASGVGEDDCFAGARYYLGGHVSTIRGSNCN